MNILKLINDFKKNNSALWVEGDNLKLFVSDAYKSQDLKDLLVEFKKEILGFLVYNEIYAKNDFLNKKIFKSLYHSSVLSFAQERLWFIEQYEEGTNAYHIPQVFELHPSTDVAGIQYALQQIIARHEVLRSTIEQGEDGGGIQVVHTAPLVMEAVELTDLSELDALLKADINQPFDLRRSYPIRVKFYTLPDDIKRFLLINVHHIANDAWSDAIFQRELMAYYSAYVQGDRSFSLPALEIQYKDYAMWQRSYLTDEVLTNQLSYWKQKLSGYQTLELPTDYVRPAQTDYRGASEQFVLNAATSARLRALVSTYGTTLHSALLSSIGILLGKYSGQQDIVIGSPIANRHHRQTEALIGFFVNTQVHRMLLNDKQSYEELLLQVHQDQVAAQLHQDLPFEKLVEELEVERDPSHHPVFQVMVVIQSFDEEERHTEQEQALLLPYDVEEGYAIEKFDLSVFFDDNGTEIVGGFSYATCLFTRSSIIRMIDHYVRLLDQLLLAPKVAYSTFSLLSAPERAQLLSWNVTDAAYSDDCTIQVLFEEQVLRTPGSIALVYEGQELSYEELNRRSNALARHIRSCHERNTGNELTADTLVALCVERGLEMIVGILAVLKAGGAYVPIDPGYPQERIDYILSDTGASLILSQRSISASLSADKVVNIDLSEELYTRYATDNLPACSNAGNLAYVIYTSGTTGQPKGVMVEHRSVVSLVYSNYISVRDEDVFLFLSSPVFDAATFEIWTPLLKGNLLVIARDIATVTSGVEDFKQLLHSYNISILWLTKTLFDSLFYVAPSIFKGLQYLIIGGEALDKVVVSKLANAADRPVHFLNGYGPTESTTFTCTFDLTKPFESNNVPIGAPIANRAVYVLDNALGLVPVGVIGELYIGGAGLARGYLNRPELTKERFIANPFVSEDAHLYKTGDLVRWLPDGNLEYLGRNDDQVKIRGYRIELGEVEHALLQVKGIRQGCVLVKERTTAAGRVKYLVGYYVGESSLQESWILEELSRTLPEYMVPSTLIALDSLPLTQNGKLDKRSLPEPVLGGTSAEYVAATTEQEKLVCGIWQEVLGVARVGITDNFFRVGGNSILAIQVSHRMSRALGYDVRVADIFKHKTIAELLRHSSGDGVLINIPCAGGSTGVLSFAQERLWFIEQYEEGTNAYHMVEVYELAAGTDVAGIRYALQQIIARHEVLRSTIERGEGGSGGIQVVHSEPLLIDAVELIALSELDVLLKADINQPFNLSNSYPIRVKFYTLAEDDKRFLLINVHHIASDGWSTEIFQRELMAYYSAYVQDDRSFSLPPLEIQYKDYAMWQRSYLTGEVLTHQLSYWKQKLSGYQTLELPTDYVRPVQIDYRGASEYFVLSAVTSARLRALVRTYGATLHSAMLSSIGILLGKYSGQQDIVIGSPIANRHYRQTRELIGFFVNMLINRLLISDHQSYEELLLQVHQDQVAAQLHQDLPFERLVEELDVERDASRHPVFQVALSVQRFDDLAALSNQDNLLLPYDVEEGYAVEKFDLSIFINDSEEEIGITFSYATSLFTRSSILRMIDHYVRLLDQLLLAPKVAHSTFSLLSAPEHAQLLSWNATDSAYPDDRTMHVLFEEQVLRTPESIALVYEDQELSYEELNCRSNALARHIRSWYKRNSGEDLTADTLVALCVERGLEMIVGILAVLKAGGAYVPLDPGYPQERIDYILSDTGAALILSLHSISSGGGVNLPEDKVVNIDFTEALYANATDNLPAYSNAGNLAYVIYTSGTTGQPKGVMVEHRSLINLIFAKKHYSVNETSRVLQFASLVFDASVWELSTALLSGATLFIVPAEVRQDATLLWQYLSARKITTTLLPPVVLASMPYDGLVSLTTLVVGGEVSSLETLNKWNNGRVLINAYGPTENTVIATMYKYAPGEPPTKIGKPLSNCRVYVLDRNHVAVPVGVPGELYIGGAGVARGYLNRPELTMERFITNPFASEHDRANGYVRLYKTGDLVRWLPDGNLEYLGRNDDQVKIRGYRIELGEVEHALQQVKGIRQACVLAKDRETLAGSQKYLVGYYVLDNDYVSNDYAQIVNSWESLYGTVYEKALDGITVEADFSGWNSYITQTPIPLHEMKAWQAEIIGVIKSLHPSRVLEIGVGSGLLMYPLLNEIKRYVGLDISLPVINRHKAYLEDKLYDVDLYHLRADQIDQLSGNELYDTIIVNSVCQYFPSIYYFNEMLEKAIAKLSDGGSIFLGDIRNYDLHKELLAARLDHEGQHYTQQHVDQLALKENELLISPSYFSGLHKRYNNINVIIHDRQGDYENELSRFRYDVIISFNKNEFQDRGASDILLSGGFNVPFLNQLSKAEIISQLSAVLPEYMVPSTLVALESMPVTLNGKLDKRALPDPMFGGMPADHTAATTEQEELVCGIWQEVMGVERVGITDNFFRIGGNSILAIQVSHRMTRALGREVRVADVFKHKTIAELLGHNGVESVQVNIPCVGGSTGVLSFAQERLWFIEQYEEGTNAYHIPDVYELAAGMDVAGIQYALQQIIARHEVLRSSIEQGEDGGGIQVVHSAPLIMEAVELTDRSELDTLLKADINQPFDLRRSYPIRVKFYTLLEGSEVKRFVLINVHHIVSDGWSSEVFQRELKAYYSAYVRGDLSFSLPPLEIQYKDYAMWQRSYLTGEVLSHQLNYWKQKLSGYQTLELPTDYVRPPQTDYRGASEQFVLGAATCARLRALVRTHGATLHSALLGSIGILLGKYSGQQDIVIGSPIANRHHQQTEALIGFFVNTQVHRMLLSDKQSYEELVLQVHQDQVAAQLHQDLPFERLVEELEVERDASRHPVFQVMLLVQRFEDLTELFNQDHLVPYAIEEGYAVEKFDLSIFINDNGDEIGITFSYATGLFARSSILRMIDHYVRLLDQLLLAPQVAYSTFSLLSASEHAQLLEWNATDSAYPDDRTIQMLFEEQVLRTPGSIALVYEGQELSYEELNRRSNALARHIRSCYKRNTGGELRADTLVALCVERGLEMIVGILAVLKAGGAYVPIDPGYPQERIDYILSDTGVALILSQRNINTSLPTDKVVNIDLSEAFYTGYATDNLPAYSSAGDLVYVLYTSGTTGRPKGVMLEHFSVCNRINYMIECSAIGPSDVYLFKTNYVFDVSFFEVFTHLCVGARLQITRSVFDIEELTQLLLSDQFTSLHLVPSQYELLASVIKRIHLSKLYFSGEALTATIVSDIAGAVKIYNYYGPTESGEITVSIPSLPAEAPVIGKVFPNCRAYVLDSSHVAVPVGVIGELYIGGAGIARGYLKRPKLTMERFITNPFASEYDRAKGYTRLYKTGDLVRWLPDGNLVYMGRNDDQVKIRGYRIELGEVEHALLQVSGIRQGCILVKERTTAVGCVKYLVGYYVGESSLQESWILEELSRILPEYMVPSTLIALESLPLTQNGKLDKRSLPEPVLGEASADYVAATTEQEELVCGIWQEVLGIERVGITDNFFHIGGNSILAIQVSHRMTRALGRAIRVADVFSAKSIDKLILKLNEENNQLIKPYQGNYFNDLIDLIFISPGSAGSEVYQNLAERLMERYNCIGIDNYNIYNQKKITSPGVLANHYLSEYELQFSLKGPINLIGWSLGGQIALEMAAILERKGYKTINVFLLDTYIRNPDEEPFAGDVEDAYISLTNRLGIKENDADYIANLKSTLKAEMEIVNTSISNSLSHTRVVLFKAMQEENDTSFNNIDLITRAPEIIRLDCHHYNLLTVHAKTISKYLLEEEYLIKLIQNNKNSSAYEF